MTSHWLVLAIGKVRYAWQLLVEKTDLFKRIRSGRSPRDKSHTYCILFRIGALSSPAMSLAA